MGLDPCHVFIFVKNLIYGITLIKIRLLNFCLPVKQLWSVYLFQFVLRIH